MGLLWSSRCEVPINWLQPHEGDRCPYCNELLQIHRLGKDWPPLYDSLYRVLWHEQLKSCETCPPLVRLTYTDAARGRGMMSRLIVS